MFRVFDVIPFLLLIFVLFVLDGVFSMLTISLLPLFSGFTCLFPEFLSLTSLFGSFALLSHALVVDEEVEFNHQWLNSKVLAVEVFSTRFHWNNLHK